MLTLLTSIFQCFYQCCFQSYLAVRENNACTRFPSTCRMSKLFKNRFNLGRFFLTWVIISFYFILFSYFFLIFHQRWMLLSLASIFQGFGGVFLRNFFAIFLFCLLRIVNLNKKKLISAPFFLVNIVVIYKVVYILKHIRCYIAVLSYNYVNTQLFHYL